MKQTVFLILAISILAFSRSDEKAASTVGYDSGDSRDFDIEVFRSIALEKKGNVFISPLSIDLALAMVVNGANDRTRTEIENALGLTEDFNADRLALMKDLTGADPKVKIEIANSLWGNENVKIKEDFTDRIKRFYEAKFEKLEFGDSGAVKVINNWVEEKTKGLIAKIIKSTDELDILILINAIYFNGEWAQKFEAESTYPGIFHALDGEKEMELMSKRSSFPYMENEGLQAIELSYGGGRFSAIVVLPEDLAGYVQTFDSAELNRIRDTLKRQEGYIHLPRFQMEYGKTINENLRDLGISAAFDPDKANFKGITDVDPCYISSVIHKAVLKVDEEGTEAAAVTAIQMRTTSMPPSAAFTMKVDRPFLWIMHDNETERILFIGAVYNPVPLEDD